MNELANDIAQSKSVKEYGLKSAAQEIGVSVATLLSWEKYGILRPGLYREGKKKNRTYYEKDIMRAVLVKLLMDTGLYTIEKAKQRVEQLG